MVNGGISEIRRNHLCVGKVTEDRKHTQIKHLLEKEKMGSIEV